MSLVRYQPTAEAPREWVALLPPAVELAKAVANTEFVPAGLRGNPAAITAAILYGDEIGLRPMQALANIAVIDGRPSLSAEAMRALVLAAGHEVWIEESTATRVTVAGRRHDSEQSSRVTWTMDDARRANLDGKRNWRTYPRQMLMARATAELARAIFADAIGGFMATEELEDSGAVDDKAPDAATASGSRRRRRATLAPVSSPAEDAPEATDAPPRPSEGDPPPEGVPGPTQQSAASGLGEDAPEAAPSDALTGTPAFRKMMALYREVGIESREARLVFARFAVGRPLESSKDLTEEEVGKVIDALEAHRG